MPPTWGGERSGAGRPRIAGRRPPVAHRRRSPHVSRFPVHVTLRAIAGLGTLRASPVFEGIREALRAASGESFRVVQFSVQSDHIHFIAEASDGDALSLGLRGLVVRVARAVNRALRRTGACGAIAIMHGRFARRARRGPRWSTSCRTGRSTSGAPAGLTDDRPGRGSMDGCRSQRGGRCRCVRWLLHELGSPGTAGETRAVAHYVSMKRQRQRARSPAPRRRGPRRARGGRGRCWRRRAGGFRMSVRTGIVAASARNRRASSRVKLATLAMRRSHHSSS